MIWKSCDLQIKEGQTEDVLGNQTGGEVEHSKKDGMPVYSVDRRTDLFRRQRSYPERTALCDSGFIFGFS